MMIAVIKLDRDLLLWQTFPFVIQFEQGQAQGSQASRPDRNNEFRPVRGDSGSAKQKGSNPAPSIDFLESFIKDHIFTPIHQLFSLTFQDVPKILLYV